MYKRQDVGIGNGLDPAIGFGGGYAMATCEARDWVNSKLVLNVGSNFLESSLPNVRLFFEAKEAGTRMVTVDPHFSKMCIRDRCRAMPSTRSCASRTATRSCRACCWARCA